ncbi:hypothetical protein OIU78_025810 [Salix suchowensis]|nr:hypothetical protein OIU78_025810 [Salix suchowensis]
MAGIKSAVFLMLITFPSELCHCTISSIFPCNLTLQITIKSLCPSTSHGEATGISAFSFENSTTHRRCTIPRHDHLSSFSSSRYQLFPSWCPNFYYL